MLLADMILYQAGSVAAKLPLRFRFHLGLAGLAGTAAAGLTRYVEFWCQSNCRGKWQISETCHELAVSFERDQDVVMFHLSDEFSRFATKAESILERPSFVH